jgi:hypothetical protein
MKEDETSSMEGPPPPKAGVGLFLLCKQRNLGYTVNELCTKEM